jgi:hypothetical protein
MFSRIIVSIMLLEEMVLGCFIYRVVLVHIFTGEQHEVLKVDDFALGFMNSTMEAKLREYQNIICTYRWNTWDK